MPTQINTDLTAYYVKGTYVFIYILKFHPKHNIVKQLYSNKNKNKQTNKNTPHLRTLDFQSWRTSAHFTNEDMTAWDMIGSGHGCIAWQQ